MLVTAEGIEVQAHAVVLLAVPYLSDAIRELRHKRLDDSELMTIAVPELRADAVRAALRFAYSGTFEMPDEVHQTVHLLQCAAAFQMVPLIRACARTLERMLAPECVAEVWEASEVVTIDMLGVKALAEALEEALKVNASLTDFDISENNHTSQAAGALRLAVKDCKRLKLHTGPDVDTSVTCPPPFCLYG